MKNILNSIKNTATGLVESVKSHFVHEVSTPVVEAVATPVVEEVAKKNGLKAAVNAAKAVVTAHPVATIAIASVVVVGITTIAVVSHKKKKANKVVKADEKVDVNIKSNDVNEKNQLLYDGIISIISVVDSMKDDIKMNMDCSSNKELANIESELEDIKKKAFDIQPQLSKKGAYGKLSELSEKVIIIYSRVAKAFNDEDIEGCSESSSESDDNR